MSKKELLWQQCPPDTNRGTFDKICDYYEANFVDKEKVIEIIDEVISDGQSIVNISQEQKIKNYTETYIIKHLLGLKQKLLN